MGQILVGHDKMEKEGKGINKGRKEEDRQKIKNGQSANKSTRKEEDRQKTETGNQQPTTNQPTAEKEQQK